jgi:hypothetical protein
MATKKTGTKSAQKKPSAKKKAAEPVVKTTEEILALFQKDAEKHLDVLKRIRTRIAPGATILLSHGDTDK